MSNKYGPRIVTDGLVLCLDAADRNSYPGTGTTWYDLSGNGNNGTLKLASQFNSENYFEYAGNGTDRETVVAGVPVNTNSSEGNTVEQWIWCDSIQGNGNMPFVWLNSGNSWDIWIYPTFGFGINNGASLIYGIPSTNISSIFVDKWVHSVVYFPNNWVSNYTNAKIWLNGQSQDMGKRNGNITTQTISSSQNIAIGGGYGGGDQFTWYGRIANTNIYSRELTTNEVLQNYNATKGRFGL